MKTHATSPQYLNHKTRKQRGRLSFLWSLRDMEERKNNRKNLYSPKNIMVVVVVVVVGGLLANVNVV